jgi:hypothetical protein
MGAVTRAGFRTRTAFLAVLSVTVYLLVFVLLSALAHAELNIVLKNDFIEKYKDRATITAQFTVVAASKVHPASQDADIHIAGRSEDIGLPVVAEIMNAKGAPAALKAVKAGENSGEPVPVIGAWRIWAEHGGIDDQVQGAPVTVADSNPPHVFQIHPVSQFDNKSVLKSLHPIQGYTPKKAHDAFMAYERLSSVITPGADTTTIRTVTAGYNYVKFIMELSEEPTHETDSGDGRSVFAKVYDTDCELLLHKRRMIFVKDSPPEQKVKTLHRGRQLLVLGLPRIDLSLVSFRTGCDKDPACKQKHPDVLQWSLPYEIIVVGVYGAASCPAP